jgi:gliding motility-associated-like protein
MNQLVSLLPVRALLVVSALFLSAASFAQENCSNNIDDDADGLIDCLDPDCMTDPACPAFAFPGSCLPIGYYPDITGTEDGFKPAGSTADVNIPIIPGSNRVSLIIQGCYQGEVNNGGMGVNDLNHAEERVIWGRVEMDLDNDISSGWVEYLVNNHESRRFTWVDQPMSPANTSTYTSIGYDMNELLTYEFVFDQAGANLVVGCTRPEIDISYYAIYYGNFTTQSLTRIDGANTTQYPAYFDSGTLPANVTQTIDLQAAPNDPDYIQIRAIGINQNRYGNSGVLVEDVREECISIKYMLLDLNSMTATGAITVSNGNIPDMASSFTFKDYDLTSGQSILNNATTLGDIVANQTAPNQISIADMTLEIVGNQLIITRESAYANDYNEIYYIEFLKYTDEPYSSSFFITDNAYSGPTDIGFDSGANNNGVGVSGFVDFTIPNGAKRAYLEVRANGNFMPFSPSSFYAPAPSNTTKTNGNQMYCFTEVNFDLNATTGFYATVTTATQQQLYAWQEIPINPLVDLTTTGIYGQLPSSDERINFEIIAPDIFRVHLTNDNIAYERTLQITFLGSKVNLVYSTFDQNTTLGSGCDSVYFDMEVCNSGGSDLTQPVPVSFYYGDPQTDPTAIYLQTNMYNLNIEQGQCETFTFGVDINSLGGLMSGDVTVVLNDNGSYGGVPGNQIPATFQPMDLFNQGNPVLECEFEYNFISAPYTITPPAPPTITFNNNTFTICPNDDATIIATPVGATGTVTYDWSPDPGFTNTLTVSPDVLTWYYLTITDECNSATDSVKVDIGTVSITDINIVDATNCPGQPGLPGAIEVLPIDPGFTYTLTGGGDVFGPQTSNMFVNLDGGVIYFLHVEDADGCTIDTAVTVGLGANAVTATWNPGALQDVTCFGDLNGAASVTNVAGGITPPYDITWTTTSGLYDQTTVGVGGGDNITNLFGGNWVVTVTDQEGCAWSFLFSIFEPAELTLDFISNDPSCYLFTDGSVTASTSGGNGGNIFTMSNSAGTPLNLGNSNTINNLGEGWYYTVITDDTGCMVEDSIFIDDPGELAVDLLITDPLCYGSVSGVVIADTVYNYTGSFGNIGYYWAPNPGGTNGLYSDTLTNLPEGAYVLTLNDENGCSNTFDFNITYPDSMYFTEIGSHPAFCRLFPYQSGNGVVYAAAAGGTGNFEYTWINLDTETSSSNSTWGGLNPASYQIYVIDDNGCLLTQTLLLDSLNPIADFEMTSPAFTSNYYGTAPVPVHFVNLSQNYANPWDPNADTTFFWNFNTPTAGWIISHDIAETFDSTYYIGGTYSVCLVALNKNGCSDTLCKPLVVYDDMIFEPINIFTPNGDGNNDVFTFDFRAFAVAEFECTIVDRWGVTMFEMDDIADTWDGKDDKGNKCTDGVYFYTYRAAAQNGIEILGQGTVTIAGSK